MKKQTKIMNHEIWHVCTCCGLWYDLREVFICPDCKTPKPEENGI